MSNTQNLHLNLKKRDQSQSQTHSKQQQKVRQQELKQIVLKNQSQQQKGFYTFKQWRQLHQVMFALQQHHITTTVINCWRILKLINFGDDYVPTGLVYDCLMTLINVDQTVEQTQFLLKSIFFKFIQFNGKYLSDKEKDQLAFFKVVRNIVEGYRKIISDNLMTGQQLAENSSVGDRNIDRNQQLYRLHNVFTYKKNLQKLKKIESQFKECSFEPKINSNSSQIGESRYLNYINTSANKGDKSNNEQFGVIDETEEFNHNEVVDSKHSYSFKANPVPVYPEIDTPQGINQHLERMQRSRQILRINSLQNSLKKTSISNVQQFSINQRAEQRKRRKLQNCRILFMIKVEVGKRTYRVKVRENMGVVETVKAIQSMVGFKDSEIEDVVKSYFINWELREKKKHQSHRMNEHNEQQQQFSLKSDTNI